MAKQTNPEIARASFIISPDGAALHFPRLRQRPQRVVIARALSLKPDFLVADEPTSMLDLSVQAKILQLLKKLKELKGLGILLISHDRSLLEAFCDRVMFLDKGRLVNNEPGKNLLNYRL